MHPLNRDFEWQCAPTQGRVPAALRSQFDEYGFCLYAAAFDADQMARAIAEIDPFEEEVERFLQTRKGGRLFIARSGEITFATHLVARSSYLRRLSVSPPVLDLCHDLIGPDVRLYWDQAVYKKPGAVHEFPFHQDNGYTYLEPQQYLTCWVALVDATVENGCPWVIPGWHRFGTLAHEPTELGWCCVESSADAVPVPARAGDIVVFSSLAPHRTGPNTSSGVRKAYILQYAPDGARALAPGETAAVLQDDPDRQYPVLSGGEPARFVGDVA